MSGDEWSSHRRSYLSQIKHTPVHQNPLTAISFCGLQLSRAIHYQRTENENTANVPELDGRTPLFGAIIVGDVGCVRQLMEFGALPNTIDNDGVFPLLLAVARQSESITEYLLEHGADPHFSQSHTGTRAIHIASRNGDPDVLRLLIRYNVNLDAVEDTSGNNALYFAAENGHTEIVEILLQNGAVVTNSAIQVAKDNGHYILAECLWMGLPRKDDKH